MEDLDGRIQTLARWMAEAERLVIFTGAGISTDSGLPDFRGPDGVWTRKDKGLPPRDERLDWTRTDPNVAHHAIVDLQEMGKLDFLVSQNIDNLHLASGSDSKSWPSYTETWPGTGASSARGPIQSRPRSIGASAGANSSRVWWTSAILFPPRI